MTRQRWLFVRVAGAVAGVAALVAGTVLALQGGGSPAASGGAGAILPQATTEPYTATVEASTPPAQTTTATISTEPAQPVTSATQGRATTVVLPARPVSQPPSPSTAVSASPTAQAGTDIPIYKDTQVLAMAAGVILPSGKTFEQCVALGPNGARWPVPVHLYYEGQGKWLVETHLGEIETEFDEATATFHVKHFAPEAQECR
jgi:hypothetical protein